ncbi:type VI secretion system Vgr family protein [Burkholderia sp. AU33545]|uniref:type VI secretion system Vgr family protein n=1 Tax=Burkholderia sp. AU33545 TaxID=2879631 RepID=UPI001CF56387|nr:type VI secretion system Vgr family protein [Burkholderia sp. AU33545]MCA8203725.1 type VI secretion system Vgr family protein [Burkholderia sp. AU33545]
MSFAANGNPDGMGGGGAALVGGLSNLGSLAGMAGQLGALTGMPGAGLLGGAASAVQLAQTGLSLMGKAPESIAEAINSLTGALPRLTQDNRFITIETPLGPDVLLVSAAIIDEHVNQLTETHLDLLSHRNNIEPQEIVGQRVKITLEPQSRDFSLTRVVTSAADTETKRYFDGYVASFGRVGKSGSVTRYEMSVVPWFWFLTRSTDCRIFQNQTPQDILSDIFREMGFSDFEFAMQGERPKLEYIVMYDESYYSFCSRLMEQEGLIWTIRYEKDKHILVIGDTNAVFQPIPNLKTIPYEANSAASEQNGIDRWDEAFSFRVGKITYRDFNYNQPSSQLMHVEVPTVNLKHPNIQTTERYQFHSLYDHGDDGQRYACYAMEAEEALAHRFNGAGHAHGMTTSGRFTLVNHGTSAYNNKDFVILRVRHQVANDYTQQTSKLPYHNTFTCLPIDIPFRPERRTPKPHMQGTQSAIVVGPKGEEIHTDGSRVKLHFLWDRRGKLDGSDSMWVRVSQPWAGKGWGGSAIPRIGQEVLVSFNQGDPDNPIVVGRVFNGDSGNPYHGSGGQTMGMRSQTHKGEGFNELRFSDVNGAQEVFLHAQKDMKTIVKDSESHTVESGARNVSVLKGDESKHVAEGSLSEKIAKARFTTANTVGVQALAGDAGPGKQSYQATDEIEHRVGASIVTLKPDSIKLSHGASSILINQSGIFLDGPVIHLNQGLFVTPEQAMAIEWANQQAVIAAGLASADPKVQAAARKLQATVKAQQLAKLAEAVYTPGTAPPGWKNVSNDPEALKKFGMRPQDLKIPGSNFGAQVYAPDPAVFGDSMKPTLAFKGTQPTVKEDWSNNLSQGLGDNSPYYDRAVTLGKKIYGSGNAGGLDLTGHSLGGGLASAASQASGAGATTFNAAGLNPETLPLYGATPRASSITNYRVDGDILTGSQEGGLGPISDVTSHLMPKAVGEQITIPGTSVTTVQRHMMGQVTSGLNTTVAEQQSSLLGQLQGH